MDKNLPFTRIAFVSIFLWPSLADNLKVKHVISVTLKSPSICHWSKIRKLAHYITCFISCMTKLSILKLFFRNNEPLILQNQTCLLEYEFIYCGTSIIFLRGRGCHMNAGRLVWLVCTNSPSRSWGWAMHQQPCMAYMLTQAHCSVAPTLPLCNCPLVYIFPLLCA